MSLTFWDRLIFLLALTSGTFSIKAAAQVNPACVAGQNVAEICFPTDALQFARCDHQLVPKFRIVTRNDEPFYFTYQVLKDQQAVTEEVVVGHTLETPYAFTSLGDEAAAYLRGIPYQGTANYSIHVKVYMQGSNQPAADDLFTRDIPDQPNVQILAIGISKYVHSDGYLLPNLQFADDDATAVRDFMSELFPSAKSILLTSKDPNHLPSRTTIYKELDKIGHDDNFCSSDDWFIFYFSGHGVVASDRDDIDRYLGAYDLDPADVSGTAVWVNDLATKIKKIRAKNKLIIIDSCFSGTTPTPRSQSTQRESSSITTPSDIHGPTSKVAYIKDKHLSKALEIGAPDQGDSADPDSSFADDIISYEDSANRSALYLAAASSDHVAEEGRVTYDRGNDHYTLPSNEAEDPDGGSVGETSTDSDGGHGFYTYVFLSQLEKKIPASFSYTDVLKIDDIWGKGNSCSVNFEDIQTLSRAAFVSLSRDDVQKPDSPKPTHKKALPVVACVKHAQEGH